MRQRAVNLLVTGLVLALWLPFAAVAQQQGGANDLILVLDGSNSMWGQIDGENKIVIARRAVGELIDTLPDDSQVGVVAYGHRREGDCEDIETIQDVSPIDKPALKSLVNEITPKGKTPITAALEAAFNAVEPERRASIILVSDGLETCSKDPCGAVRTARESGLPFVLHVVGFDVAGEDTAQLECAAQAGGGVYLGVGDAPQLSDALATAYEKPTTPDGALIVTTTANDELQDATVRVFDSASGEEIVSARTYASDATNPRRIPLEDGDYTARIAAVGIAGQPHFDIEFSVSEDGAVERSFDFSSGEVAVAVTRNGALSDATVRVLSPGEKRQIAAGRTYVAASSNPRVMTVPAGTYDVEVRALEIAGTVEHRFDGIAVRSGKRLDLAHDFDSGTLNIGVRRGDALIDATVQIYAADGGSIVGRRVYARPDSNPRAFTLSPGDYRIRISEVRGERVERSISLAADESIDLIVDLDATD